LIKAPLPPFRLDLVRLSQGNQVPDRPGDDVAVPLEIAFAPNGRAEDSGNVLGNGGLFGKDRDGSGFAWVHRYPQFTAAICFDCLKYRPTVSRCLGGHVEPGTEEGRERMRFTLSSLFGRRGSISESSLAS